MVTYMLPLKDKIKLSSFWVWALLLYFKTLFQSHASEPGMSSVIWAYGETMSLGSVSVLTSDLNKRNWHVGETHWDFTRTCSLPKLIFIFALFDDREHPHCLLCHLEAKMQNIWKMDIVHKYLCLNSNLEAMLPIHSHSCSQSSV